MSLNVAVHRKEAAMRSQLQCVGRSRGGIVPRAGGGHRQIAAREDDRGHQQTAAHGQFSLLHDQLLLLHVMPFLHDGYSWSHVTL